MNPSSRFALPLGLLGMLILIFGVESTFARHSFLFVDPVGTNWRFSAHQARNKALTQEILCFGTSLLKFGLVPRSIQIGAGRSTYNLAVCNAHMPTSYFLLRSALESGARPSALVVDCQDGPVARDHINEQHEALRVNLQYWPEMLTARDTLDLSWTARDTTFFTSMTLAGTLHSYKDRFGIRKAAVSALEGKTNDLALISKVNLRSWRVNQGVQLMPGCSIPAAPGGANPAEIPRQPFSTDRFTTNPLTEVYLKRFIDLARAHKIRVFWVLPPIRPNVQRVRNLDGFDDYFTKLARQVQRLDPTAVVIDGREANYPEDVFYDTVHMNVRGAVAFSEALAGTLNRALSGLTRRDEWVMMAPFHDAEQVPPLEDITASKTIVENTRETRLR